MLYVLTVYKKRPHTATDLSHNISVKDLGSKRMTDRLSFSKK